MYQPRTSGLVGALVEPPRLVAPEWDSALRVAAATLSGARENEVSATTVVVAVGADDLGAFHALVQDLADEFDLTTTVRPYVGSCSVRFGRRPISALVGSG